jgi:Gas vesicle synthesis protein GvpL/GvpF
MAGKVKAKGGHSSSGTKSQPSSSAIYLYGLTQTGGRSLPPTAKGVDAISAVEVLPCAGFFCWLSRVNRAEFSDQLQQNMENLEWLAAASIAHHRVVDEIAKLAEILPARFGTVFLNEKSLVADVQRRKESLTAAFKRITGTEEWGVKVFDKAPQAPTAVTARSGKDYLLKKSAALEGRKVRKPDPGLEAFAAALGKVALDEVRGGKFSGAQRDLGFQASYLIRRDQREKFHGILKQYAKKWGESHRIEYAGPWPPYSFVSSDGQ